MMMWRWRGTVLCCAVVYCIVWGNAIRFIDMGRAERPSGRCNSAVRTTTSTSTSESMSMSMLLSHMIIIACWCSEPGLNDCIVVFCAGIPMLSVRLLRKRYLSYQREHALLPPPPPVPHTRKQPVLNTLQCTYGTLTFHCCATHSRSLVVSGAVVRYGGLADRSCRLIAVAAAGYDCECGVLCWAGARRYRLALLRRIRLVSVKQQAPSS